MIRTTAGQIHVSSYTKIDLEAIASHFGAPKSVLPSELIDYPIDKELEAKLMPVGWRATLGRSHEDVQAMEIIRKAAKLIEAKP